MNNDEREARYLWWLDLILLLPYMELNVNNNNNDNNKMENNIMIKRRRDLMMNTLHWRPMTTTKTTMMMMMEISLLFILIFIIPFCYYFLLTCFKSANIAWCWFYLLLISYWSPLSCYIIIIIITLPSLHY